MNTYSHKSSLWEPPVELQRSTPREVQLTKAGKAAVAATILLIAAAVGGSVALASKASADERRWAAWQAEAVTVKGEVTALRKRSSGDNTRYYADYTYPANDRNYSATASLHARDWRQLRRGEEIEVSYRRSEPSQSWIAGAEPTGMPLFVPALFGVCLLVPVPILVFTIRRQRRLLEEGRAAQARVVSVRKVRSQHGSHCPVEYEFETIAGTRRRGKYDAQRKPPQVGDVLVVVYHPDEEKWSAKYPLSLVKVAGND